MVEIDKRLENVVVNHANAPMNVEIKNENNTFFSNDSLKDCVQNSELIYADSFETNRKRKMRLAKIINDELKTFPINDENIDCADEIITTLVNNTLFENMSNFSNLEFSEEKFKQACNKAKASNMSLKDVRNQCFKDLFTLRLVWFSNEAHKLLSQMPIPQNENARKEFLIQKTLLREYINQNTKEYIQFFTNEVNPKWLYDMETSHLTIYDKKQQFTQFADGQLQKLENNLLRNGDCKNANTCLNNFADAKLDLVDFFEIIKLCKTKYRQQNPVKTQTGIKEKAK